MKKSFDKQWKAILRNAEEQAPIEVWENISQRLDEDASFEESLSSTLLNAEEKPEDDVWAAISNRLDKEEERKPVFFVWFNKYTASGIAALLLMVLGFSLFNKSDFLDNGAQQSTRIERKSDSSTSSQTETNQRASESESQERLILADQSSEKGEQVKIERKSKIETVSLLSSQSLSIPDYTPLSTESSKVIEQRSNDKGSFDSKVQEITTALNFIARKEFDEFANSFILHRPKLPYETPEEFQEDNSSFFKKSWFGLISGISPFEPNFKINNFERALASANDIRPTNSFEFNNVGETTNPIKRETFAIPLSQPYNNIRAGNSINLGLDYGKRFGKHLSWQGGIRFNSGRSLLESNVYSYNEKTGDVRTFLESNYIRNDITSFDNTIVSTSGLVNNDYKYLMVPLQLAYHMPLGDKMEMALSSGISTDFLVNNVIDNTPEGGSLLTAQNSAYKVMNLSGIGSLKVNYMIGENWQLSVGSNVQQTLTSGVDKLEGFSFRPRYIGINTGVNYRFN
ncbi:hypothetical protein [Jiulongibacter sp. NS-SX5]|uniref:hypothetical protein n=1 Tax=Jiulongibacter sp. NS-SX5 TaxID=3463854 RepID=UPI004059FD28